MQGDITMYLPGNAFIANPRIFAIPCRNSLLFQKYNGTMLTLFAMCMSFYRLHEVANRPLDGKEIIHEEQ
jgi:hypothetical protein